MYYLMIITSALLFSLMFLFNDGFRREAGNDLATSLKMSLYTAIFGLLVTLIINGFKLYVTPFSVLISIVYAVVHLMLNYCTIKAFAYANLSVYSVFSMIGGMLLPFVYGAICGEEITFFKVLCCVFITISILMTVEKNTQSKKAFKYYIGVFILNGMVGVISAFHQSFVTYCVDSASFLMLSKIFTAILSVVAILLSKDKSFAIKKKALVFSAGHAVFNSIGNLMLLIALLYLPASVQYPMVTGGTIAFSVLIDVVRKIKVTKNEIIAAIFAFISSLLMAF